MPDFKMINLSKDEIEIIVYSMRFIDPKGIFESESDVEKFYKTFSLLSDVLLELSPYDGDYERKYKR